MSTTTLKRIRIASLALGSALLAAAMLVFPEKPVPRDVMWTIGVAALVFTLVCNRLLKRQMSEETKKKTLDS